MFNIRPQDYELKYRQYWDMVSRHTQVLVDHYPAGIKGWLIKDGVATPIMHDWYIELERQIRGYIEHKKDQIFNG